MVSRRALLAGSLLTLSSLGSAALAHAAAPPQSYALKPADLGSGFAVRSAVVVNNAAMAKKVGIPRAQFDRHGRLSGYEVQLEQHSTADLAFSNIYTYKSAAGAHWDFLHSTQQDLKGSKRISAPPVGAESLALYAQQKSGTLTVAFYVLDFRQGPVDNTVGVGGLKSLVSLNQALRYARIVAAREPKS